MSSVYLVIPDVLSNGIVEEDRLLTDYSETRSEVVKIEVFDVDPIDENFS